ncbi:MAG: M28 family metallopeptidase [Verrucomicrobia bacterium]|nr:M28 family metallopeptidase [Verrucomicrobiota bacterium]
MKPLLLVLVLALPSFGEIETDANQGGRPAKSEDVARTGKDGETAAGEISAIVRAVLEKELRGTVRDLVAFKSRSVGQPGNGQAAAYLHERLKRIPGLQVAPLVEPWKNVIATLPGTDATSRELFIVGAHYDSMAVPPELAPGAMDDAAGIAIVLEMARILSQSRFKHPILFACWNGEEVGLKGSREFVQQLLKDGRRVSLYLNYDSTAFDPQHRLVLDVIANPPAAAARKLLFENNLRHGIGFTLVEDRHACHGDHTPFQEAGFPVINTHQEDHGAHYHTANDTLERVSFPYAASNGQLGLSIIATLADRVVATQNSSQPTP